MDFIHAFVVEIVPEGILLIFSNIPVDATHLWISVSSDGTEETESGYNFTFSNAAITGTYVHEWTNSSRQLDMVKQTGQVIFPIIQRGVKYFISASVYNEQERELSINGESFNRRVAYTEIIPYNGTFFNRDDVILDLNNINSAVTLSSEPVFSTEIIFDDQKYSFAVTIIIENVGTITIRDHHIPDELSTDGLTWNFEPQMTENLRENNFGWLETGPYYTAWVEAHVNIIYDDIRWSVEIGRTPEFKFSL